MASNANESYAEINYCNSGNNGLKECEHLKNNLYCDLQPTIGTVKNNVFQENSDYAKKPTIATGKSNEWINKDRSVIYDTNDHKESMGNGKLSEELIANDNHANQNGFNADCARNGSSLHFKCVKTTKNRKYVTEETISNNTRLLTEHHEMSSMPNYQNDINNYGLEQNEKLHSKFNNNFNDEVAVQNVTKFHSKSDNDVSVQNDKFYSKSVLVRDQLTAKDLQSLFDDQICVLHVPNYIPQEISGKLDRFLQEKGSDQYTHEVRSKDGSTDLQYFGVNRYGRPLNSTYNDPTGESLKRYFADALPTMRTIRWAAEPYLSPIDKLRVELDELWSGRVNVATLNGRKTFCGIGRIMPASLSALSAIQPHFDSIPTSYFPNIAKQFAANIYLNVPSQGGELEIWDVPPVDVTDKDFAIPDDWRSVLPPSILVKPGSGDLLLLNTRRPHAITEFSGTEPRTSVQTFIGLTEESDVILWV